MTYIEATPERIATLPIWAQNHIGKLAADLRWTQEKFDAMTGDPTLTNTVVWGGHEERGLPKNATIRFWLERGNHWEYIDARLADDHVLIHAGNELVVSPQASNHIKLYVRGMRKAPGA